MNSNFEAEKCSRDNLMFFGAWNIQQQWSSLKLLSEF